MVAYQDVARLEQVSQKWLSPTYDELGISTRYSPTARWIARRVSTSSKAPRGGKAFGFRLTLQAHDGKPFQLLHEDKTVPGSRIARPPTACRNPMHSPRTANRQCLPCSCNASARDLKGWTALSP
jgi:hypothetical protein